MPAYQPRNQRLQKFLAMLQDDLLREFSAVQVSEVLDCDPRAVAAMLDYAMRANMVFRRKDGRRMLYRGQPYGDEERGILAVARAEREAARNPLKLKAKPPAAWVPDHADPRIGRVVPGWTPPVMRHVRGGE